MYVAPLYHWPKKSKWGIFPEVGRTWNNFSAYFHYPFCRHLCGFCGYETRIINKSRASAFEDRIYMELTDAYEIDDFSKSSLESVFFGGGTASLMPESLLKKCLSELEFAVGGRCTPEVTLECEPGTIDREKLQNAKSYGVNRISICAQSTKDKDLVQLGRKHNNSHSMKLLDDVLSVGYSNIHVDLMYNLPSQSLRDWEEIITSVTKLPVQHISTYKLYIFTHGFIHRRGALRGSQETQSQTAHAREMQCIAYDILTDAGFTQYTLTEYARPGWKSTYIKSCFDGGDILPVGPGAFGRCGQFIWENQPYISHYLADTKKVKSRGVYLTQGEAFKRDVILGLWLLRVDFSYLERRYNVEIRPELELLLSEMSDSGLGVYQKPWFYLEDSQRFDAGLVMSKLDSLDTRFWAFEHQNPCPRYPNSIPMGSEHLTGPIAQVMRIARRDAELFTSLKNDPDTALQHLGYNLLEPSIRSLISVVRQREEDCQPDLNVIRQIWIAVQQEHAGGLGSTRCAPAISSEVD